MTPPNQVFNVAGVKLVFLYCILVEWARQQLVEGANSKARACLSSEFICTTSGSCISSSKRCDGVVDCNDGSDENCCNQNSNAGKTFVVGFLPNYSSSPKNVFFLTSSKSLNYTITCPGQKYNSSGFLQANTLVTVQVPNTLTMPLGKSQNGILITGTENLIVYGLNQVQYTTDAFLALPTYIQRFEYIVASYTDNGHYQSELGVVAIENSTTIIVLPSVQVFQGSVYYNAHQNSTFVLDSLETFVLQGNDVTGTRIFSNKAISVFGGHECALVPAGESACDHLVEQMPPVATFGRRFAAVPLATRTGGDIYRVVVARDGTDVKVNGVLKASGLSAGTFHEFQSSSTVFLSVETTKPAMLVQYSKGTGADGVLSDPFMLMIPPIEQYRFRYTISTPAVYPVSFSSFLSIIVPSGEESGLRLDDQVLPLSTIWNKIPGQTLLGATIPITTGSHTVHHISPIVKLGLSVYGFASYDSYGYPGGLQLQADCSVKQTSTDIDECAPNNSRGPCQHFCNNTFGSYQCSCRDGFLLQPDLSSCGYSTKPCSCLNNGICRSGGFCECRPGWGGFDCSEPQCHLVNFCSGRGKCIAPNKCQCSKGWTGFGCAVDTCPQFATCSSCTEIPQCGWCDTQGRCLRGDGHGPSDQSLKCPAWFPYACVTVVAGQGNLPILSSFSSKIKVINCDLSCGIRSVQFRGNSIFVHGSQAWCRRRRQACLDYYSCFVTHSQVHCSIRLGRAFACRIYSEKLCMSGRPPVSNKPVKPTPSQSPTPTSPVSTDSSALGPVVINPNYPVFTPLDFRFHIYCATGKRLSDWDDYGCMCEQSNISISLSPRVSVDQTDRCCQEHDACYNNAPANCDCHSTSYGVYSPTCNKWQGSRGYCEEVYELSVTLTDKLCRKHCCECDYKGAVCVKKHTATKRDDLWKNWMDVKRGQCTPICGNVPGCPCDKECSGHGVMSGHGKESFCFCFNGWKGKCCDQADCNCRNSRGHDCFSNGGCFQATGDGSPSCRCRRGWRGTCCNLRIPVRRTGDPHIVTADGKEFDYFGIGEFWDCRSLKNDFGAQIRFFGYQGTSFVGGVALKTGNVTTSIFTRNDTSGRDRLPIMRSNNTLLSSDWSKYPFTYKLAPGVNLYVQPTRENGSVAELVFQFTSGAVYSVNVRYSQSIGRQYLDTEFGPTADYLQATEGLCGFMDNDDTNDLVGSSGKTYANTTDFVDSWRVTSAAGSNTTSWSWSWIHSNFHKHDLLDFSYTNPYHRAVYGVSQLPANVRNQSETACKALGISDTLLENCILDRGLTGDDNVLQQQVYHLGKCPDECSNRGYCNNGTCVCIESWSGLDCSIGGCSDCPNNSQCINGFCKCNLGYYGENCTQASCHGVQNCTSPLQGTCVLPDTCQCNPGHTGLDCNIPAVCSHSCSSQGTCLGDDKCLCNVDWAGDKCQNPSCESASFCSGYGVCLANGTCACLEGWQGPACDQYSCHDLNDCHGNGDCVGINVCSCHSGYTGAACNLTTTCPSVSNCSGNGICLDSSTCRCFSGYYGDSCEKFECVHGCSGRGTCEAPEICSCILGWTGFDCSVPSCEQLHYCSGHGKCASVNLCQCDDNWTADLCNVFTCDSNNRTGNCSHHGNCSSPGQCSCEKAYCGDDCQYSVLDECRWANPCSHICTDTCEAFTCSCPTGYLLGNDKVTCQDMDECNNTAYSFRLNNCAHLCTNTQGSYACGCKDGYYLGSDKGSCLDVDECSNSSHKCEQICVNTNGSYNCLCKSGFSMNGDGISCSDVDECSLQTDVCDQICVNNVGSYSCDCGYNYLLGSNGKSCDDPPTLDGSLISSGLVEITILNITQEKFLEAENNFSSVVIEFTEKLCQPPSDSRCSMLGDLLSDKESRLFVQFTGHSPAYNSSELAAYVYGYSFKAKLSQSKILPAHLLATILEENKAKIAAASFRIGQIRVVNPATTNPVTTNPVTTNPVITNPVTTNLTTESAPPPNSTTTEDSSGGGLSTTALIAIIAGVVGGTLLMLTIALRVSFCVRGRKRKREHKFTDVELPYSYSGRGKGMAVFNSAFENTDQ